MKIKLYTLQKYCLFSIDQLRYCLLLINVDSMKFKEIKRKLGYFKKCLIN